MSERYSEFKELALAMLEWIDAIPAGTVLPAMPGFDRDWAEVVLTDPSRIPTTLASTAHNKQIAEAIILKPLINIVAQGGWIEFQHNGDDAKARAYKS